MAGERGLDISEGDLPKTFARFLDRYPEMGRALSAMGTAVENAGPLDSRTAELVKLRYFIGMTMEEAAAALGLKKRTAESLWTYGRAWLRRAIRGDS